MSDFEYTLRMALCVCVCLLAGWLMEVWAFNGVYSPVIHFSAWFFIGLGLFYLARACTGWLRPK